MTAPLGEFSPEQFLREYWQRKPCLIRQAIPGFEPELDGDDLAGLACDPMAESRIVTGHYAANDWELRHGPFGEEDFARLPEERWTLLVQDVEKHYVPLMEFMMHFDFLPSWRIDDLMMSYAATGGSVGPHVDQYDVFLLQAEGRRRWQIAEHFDPQLLEDCPLNVLREFQPEREWVLEPGDMLYLPPNIAHHGIALEPGMTWSIGLRAPGAADLLMAFGEYLAHGENEGGRYADPELSAVRRAGEINPAAIASLRELMRDALVNDRAFEDFAASFLTRFRMAQEPAPAGTQLDVRQLQDLAAEGQQLLRNPWTRLAWYETAAGARLFAAGRPYDCSITLARCLCGAVEPEPFSLTLEQGDTAVVADLVNDGHFLLFKD